MAGSRDTYATIRRALEVPGAGYSGKSYKIFLQGSYGNDRSAARSRGSAENRPVESTRLLSLDNRKLLEPPICRYAKPKVFTPLSR